MGPQPTPRPGPRYLQWPQASGLAASAGPSPLSEPVGSPLRAPSLRLRPLLSALPGEGGGGGGSLSGENSSGSHPLHRQRSGNLGGLSLGLKHQRADTDPPLSCRRRRRLSRRPLPQLAAINGKMAASALARIRASGLRARRLAPKVARQLSFAYNYVSSSSASGGTKLVEQLRKRFLIEGVWTVHLGTPFACREKTQALESSIPSRTVPTPCPPRKHWCLKPFPLPYQQFCSPLRLEKCLNFIPSSLILGLFLEERAPRATSRPPPSNTAQLKELRFLFPLSLPSPRPWLEGHQDPSLAKGRQEPLPQRSGVTSPPHVHLH